MPIRKNSRDDGDLPRIHPDAFVDPTTILHGPDVVEEDVFIRPCAVARAEETGSRGQVAPIITPGRIY